MNITNIKKHLKLGVSLCAWLLLFSCKQRDDYPVFEDPKIVEVEKDTIPPDNTKESLTQKIIDGTDVIKTFQMDSMTVLAPGVNRMHVRFKNKLDQAMSMQVLELDLTQPKISVFALSPFDDNLFTTQVLSDMAKYNEGRTGGRIIAAINGDVATSGAPTGSFIRLGRQIKTSTTTATANTRPFIAVKNDETVVIGNRPNTTVPLVPYNLSDFKHLVSGGTWLVYKGGLITSAVTTVQANTAIGITADKKIYAVLVDGVNNAFSVGITFNDFGKIMKALGCSEAFSTSVGTSAVMVQRDKGINNEVTWKVVNKPATATGGANVNGVGFVVRD